jgi:hypothetical protein
VPRRKKPKAYLYRLFTLFITAALLLLSFLLIYKAKTAEAEADLLYPVVDCAGYVTRSHTHSRARPGYGEEATKTASVSVVIDETRGL